MKTVRKFIDIEILNAGTRSLGPLEVYQRTRPWKCIKALDLGSVRILIFLLNEDC